MNNYNAGEARVVIQGKVPYTGTVTKTFKISPAKNATIEHHVDEIWLLPGQTKAVPVSDGQLTGSTDDVHVTAGSGLINLCKAKIVGKGTKKTIKTQKFTGYVVRPEIDVLIKKGKKWVVVDPSCYTVTYANCVAKGNGSLFITGIESRAVGSKTAKFKIGSVSVSRLFTTLFR